MTFTKLLTIYAAALATILVGWILNVQQLYWMAGVLVLLPSVSRLYAMLEHRGLTLSRELPRTGTIGDVLAVRFRVTNTTPLPKLHLAIADDFSPGLVPEETEPVPLSLPPRGSDEVTYRVRLARRGPLSIPSVRVVSTDPLALYRLEGLHAVHSDILVYPRVVQLPADLLPTERGGGQAPLQSGQRRGESPSFFGIREYRPGDPLKHVHWRTAARTGRLSVVEWEAEESVDALIAVDTGPDANIPYSTATVLDVAAGLAASVAGEILNAGDTVRLLLSGDTGMPVAVRGFDALSTVLERLARAKGGDPTSLAASLTEQAQQLPPGMLICCIAGAPDPALGPAIRTLVGLRMQPVVYALLPIASMEPLPAEWSDLVSGWEGAGARVVRLYQDDDVVVRLVS